MSHDHNPRGGQWLGRGEDVVAERYRSKGGTYPVAERDWCDVGGAAELKRRIEAFWLAQGCVVACRIERVSWDGRATAPTKIYGQILVAVRSDLVNGMPPPAAAQRMGEPRHGP